MSVFRRVFSLILVLALLSTVSLSALAAEFDAADAAQMEEAFNYSGEDSQVNINVTANIDMNGGNLTAAECKTYNVTTQNDSTLNEVKINGSGTVNIGTDITGEDRAALYVYGDATVTVTGDITSQYDGVHAGNNSNVTVTGDIDADHWGVDASGGTVTVNGNVKAGSYGVEAYNDSTVKVTGGIIAGSDGVDARGTSKVTVGDGITATGKGVIANGSSNVTVTGTVDAGYEGVYTMESGTVDVIGNVISDKNGVEAHGSSEITVTNGIDAGEDGVYAEGTGTVTVTGGIKAESDGVDANRSSKVTVTGDIKGGSDGVYATDDCTVDVTGNIEGGKDGLRAYESSTVTVNGNVSGSDGDRVKVDFDDPRSYSDGGGGISASEKAVVTVTGNVRGGTGYGTRADGGDALSAAGNASVTVGGSVIGGSVTAKPETEGSISRGGFGVVMEGTATVKVGGGVLGGSTNGNRGEGGCGVYLAMAEGDEPGSLTVGGQVKSGTGGEDGKSYGDLYFKLGFNDFENLKLPVITMGGYDTVDGRMGYTNEPLTQEQLDAIFARIRVTGLGQAEGDAELPDLFWLEVEQQLRSAEPGSELTVDAGSRTSMPTSVLKTAAERNVTLIIRWNGGDDIVVNKAVETEGYTIALAELAELVK